MTNIGISCLGLCHPKYPVGKLVKAFKDAEAVRFRWIDLFFNAKDSNNVKKLLAIPKPKFVTVSIINGPGMNNNRTQPHEITYRETTASLEKKILKGDAKFLSQFEARIKYVKSLVGSETRTIINPWLEHQPIQKKTLDVLADIVLNFFGDICIDNPRSGNSFFSGYVKEKHGDKPGPIDIADLDGTDWESVDLYKYLTTYQNNAFTFIWGLRENGNDKHIAEWLPPEKRTSWPTDREYAAYAYYLRPDALTVNSPLNPIDTNGLNLIDPFDGPKRDFVWKLGDGRNYAICLMPKRFKDRFKSVVLKKDGKIFDTGKFRGLYTEDGSNRQIFDFTKHIASYPDNCILVADKKFGWVLKKPQYRID